MTEELSDHKTPVPARQHARRRSVVQNCIESRSGVDLWYQFRPPQSKLILNRSVPAHPAMLKLIMKDSVLIPELNISMTSKISSIRLEKVLLHVTGKGVAGSYQQSVHRSL